MAAFRNACRAGMVLCALPLSALLPASQASAQYVVGAVPVGPERPAVALARNVRILAQNPRDYRALVGAGRAALDTGDPEAAVGFFGRAADVSPLAPAPKAGIGAALVAMGEASRALPEFARAQRLGAPLSSFAADRGLAHDLLGQQALAQADYRLALAGPDASEARRRLALSLAISGDRTGAMTALAPLLQRSDVPTNRVRAFVLALGGDTGGASRALDRSVPGMSRQLDPFLRRLPGLSPAQKAAAVHLGIIPGSGGTALASTTPVYSGPTVPISAYPPPPRAQAVPQQPSYRLPPPSSSYASTQPVTGDRLAGIDDLLRQPSAPASTAPPAIYAAPPPPQPKYELAANAPVRTSITAAAPASKRIWVQLASGADEAALSGQFARIASRQPEIFQGIRPYVSQVGDRAKLLVGPFKNAEESEIFVENLTDVRINAFSWTSPPGQIVRRLANP